VARVSKCYYRKPQKWEHPQTPADKAVLAVAVSGSIRALMRSPKTTAWHPAGWQDKPAQQQPRYADPQALERVVAELANLPPIVVSWEVDALLERLAQAQRGQAFLLQGGDCAEAFSECRSEQITKQLKILLQMSVVLLHGLKKPTIRVGRMAGQYAKPRSADTETRDGITLPSYRGDLVNQPQFTAEARAPDPNLLLRGYERAALTLNFVRALVAGGFADLHHPEYWDLGFVHHSPLKENYRRIADAIADALDFYEGISGRAVHETTHADFFASHEGLHLSYEQAQTRFIPRQQRWYNLSTHMPWIGMRTAQLDGAHVEYFRGIANPVAVKIGTAMDASWLQGLVSALNPQNQPGRLTFIHRYGAKEVAKALPKAIEAVRQTGQSVLWVCDPMHGNTETSTGGYKTRRFENILQELDLAFQIHADNGSHLGGVHIELTGEDVTECTGGARGLTDADLQRAYRSSVDPRLNHEQALELAMLIAERSQSRRERQHARSA
jgi:3-deoxy-7-phosphoheptulonate synthase